MVLLNLISLDLTILKVCIESGIDDLEFNFSYFHVNILEEFHPYFIISCFYHVQTKLYLASVHERLFSLYPRKYFDLKYGFSYVFFFNTDRNDLVIKANLFKDAILKFCVYIDTKILF